MDYPTLCGCKSIPTIWIPLILSSQNLPRSTGLEETSGLDQTQVVHNFVASKHDRSCINLIINTSNHTIKIYENQFLRSSVKNDRFGPCSQWNHRVLPQGCLQLVQSLPSEWRKLNPNLHQIPLSMPSCSQQNWRLGRFDSLPINECPTKQSGDLGKRLANPGLLRSLFSCLVRRSQRPNLQESNSE